MNLVRFGRLAVVLPMWPALAFAQQGAPFYHGNDTSIMDPATGAYCSSTTPCSIFSGGGGGGSAPSATVGSAAATTRSPVSGSDGTLERPIRTDTTGALVAAQATPSTGTVLSLSASTATQLRAASSGSRGATIRTESANTAPIYVCYVATTTCSATVHDDIIPVSTAVGAMLIPLYPVTSTIYVYSTGATSLSVTDWASK